jgi:hypothetical protein
MAILDGDPNSWKVALADPSQNTPPKREYPLFYEKAVPVAIGVLALIVVGMLVFAIAVALGLVGG